MGTLPQTVSVLGAGSWGTALARVLARNIPTVRLWGRNPEELRSIQRSRLNERYLPGVRLPDNLVAEHDLAAIVRDCNDFLVVVPSDGFRDALIDLRTHVEASGQDPNSTTLVWGTKGFDAGTGKLLSTVAEEVFGSSGTHAVVSGPSFAGETAADLPTALTLACSHPERAERLAAWFWIASTRVYYSTDMVGVQLGGAIKNVMAVAAGISDGLGFGANARAALITRGLHEMSRLGVALGGRADTFMGLTGVGDLVLTCTDDQSRNRRFGLGIGAGTPRDQLFRDIGQKVEGVNTARELYRVSRDLKVEMPITEQVYRVLHEDLDPAIAVRNLLDRGPQPEAGH